jgi:hypothetical protein
VRSAAGLVHAKLPDPGVHDPGVLPGEQVG